MTNPDKPWLCHRCGYLMDANTETRGLDVVPKEHDIAVCMNCGALYTRRSGRWVPTTEAERATLSPKLRRQIAELEIELAATGINLARNDGASGPH